MTSTPIAPVDPKVLREVLDGRWAHVRRDARENLDDPDFLPVYGESMAEAQARIVGHLQAAPAGETIAMVTHSDMIRAAVAHVLGLSLDHLLRFDIDPASVTGVAVGDWGARLLWMNERGSDG